MCPLLWKSESARAPGIDFDALQIDQPLGLSSIEPLRNPRRLPSLGALPIKQIHRAIELHQHAPERLQLLCQL